MTTAETQIADRTPDLRRERLALLGVKEFSMTDIPESITAQMDETRREMQLRASAEAAKMATSEADAHGAQVAPTQITSAPYGQRRLAIGGRARMGSISKHTLAALP